MTRIEQLEKLARLIEPIRQAGAGTEALRKKMLAETASAITAATNKPKGNIVAPAIGTAPANRSKGKLISPVMDTVPNQHSKVRILADEIRRKTQKGPNLFAQKQA